MPKINQPTILPVIDELISDFKKRLTDTCLSREDQRALKPIFKIVFSDLDEVKIKEPKTMSKSAKMFILFE